MVGRPLLGDPKGGGGCLGPWPAPADPSTHIRNRQKMEFIKGAGNLRPISGTHTFFWPLDHYFVFGILCTKKRPDGGGGGAGGRGGVHRAVACHGASRGHRSTRGPRSSPECPVRTEVPCGSSCWSSSMASGPRALLCAASHLLRPPFCGSPSLLTAARPPIPGTHRAPPTATARWAEVAVEYPGVLQATAKRHRSLPAHGVTQHTLIPGGG